jgi:hypothetical protein
MKISKNKGGRPPKFDETSKPVTVTLPEATLQKLERINPDRAKAIVKAVDWTTRDPWILPQIVETETGIRLMIIPPCESIRKLDWIRLIEISPFRHLISIEPGTSIEKIEVGLNDLIETSGNATPDEMAILNSIRQQLTETRRTESVQKAEILIFNGKTSTSSLPMTPVTAATTGNSLLNAGIGGFLGLQPLLHEASVMFCNAHLMI